MQVRVRVGVQSGQHLESLGARHTGHLIFACTISVVVSLEKLATALYDAVHALPDSHLLQQALSVNLGLLAQVSHAEVELKSKGVNRASSASERKRIQKSAEKVSRQLASIPAARIPRGPHEFVPTECLTLLRDCLVSSVCTKGFRGNEGDCFE